MAIMYPSLEAEIARRGIMKKKIAESLGISGRALSNKICGRSSFLWEEVRDIRNQFFPDIEIDKLFARAPDKLT